MHSRFDHDSQDKWLHVNQIMRDKCIAVLALQETHLTDSERDELNTLFENSLVIHSSMDPSNPGAKGTAIVLNKQLTNVNDVKQDIIIEGRAMMLSVRWHGDFILSFLSVYGPNNLVDNVKFLDSLREKLKPLRQPDFVLGDFNMVEDAIDRLPHHKDPINI
jgi:exonuclease III